MTHNLRRPHILWLTGFALLLLALVAFGCSDDAAGDESLCALGQTWNERTGKCENRPGTDFDAGRTGRDSNGPGYNVPDGVYIGSPDDAGDGDAETDSDAEQPGEDIGPIDCHDPGNANDPSCRVQTCRDLVPGVAPDPAAGCNESDPNCDNQELNCTFYAQSPEHLYQVDPFRKTATRLGAVPGLTDLDTHPDGTLYGITFSELYKYDTTQAAWQRVGSLGIGGMPNGLAINNEGTAFMTSQDVVYTVDLSTGIASVLSSVGGGFSSSGDCVVNKDNSLFMSSKATGIGLGSDLLVFIDSYGTGTAVGSGIGFRQVYGLTAAWGRMFGLTGTGELIEIDQGSGEGTLIHRFPNIVWNGAASTPNR